MKIRLLKDTRPFGRTGETVEVPPDGFDYLVSLGLGVPVEEAVKQVETPEAPAAVKPAAGARQKPAKAEKRKQK